MKIRLTSVFVDDQDRALDFYTNKLGFVLRNDIPMGEFRWLTVAESESSQVELLLEPNANPAANTYQTALLAGGIAATAFEVENVADEYQRLSDLGVEFHSPPSSGGEATIAVLIDTCGNLIQLYQT